MDKSVIKDKETMTDNHQESVPMRFCQLTRESGVLFFTELENNRIFQKLFNYLQTKSSVMTYWDGNKKTLRPRKGSGSTELTEALLSSPDVKFNKITLLKPGRKSKLTVQQELFLVLKKLRVAIVVEDLAFF